MNGRRLAAILFLCLSLLWVSALRAQQGYPLPQDRYVNDFAGLLEPAEKARLALLLEQLENETGVEATVVTIFSIQDYKVAALSVEAFATGLFNEWGVGRAERNDGVMLLLAVTDKTVRIELGAGYEQEADLEMRQIVDRTMLPYFDQADYGPGLVAGTEEVVQLLGADLPAKKEFPLVPAVAAVAGSGLLLLGWREWKRYRQRLPCPHCNRRMRVLEGSDLQPYLSEGQRVEQELSSVEHTIWNCSACEKIHVEGRKIYAPWSSYGDCPQCGYRTVGYTWEQVRASTYTERGEEKRVFTCEYCDYSRESTNSTPSDRARERERAARQRQQSRSSSSGTGSLWNSDNDSFSGGSSDGGGASGRW